MTHYLIYTEDKADSLNIRQANRAAHLEWVRSDPRVTLLSAGPWVDEAGDMRGSLLIVEADNMTTVEDWLSHDPYGQAGLTGFKRIREFKWLIGVPD